MFCYNDLIQKGHKMIKNYIILFLFSITFIFNANAQWVSLNNKSSQETPPKVSILSDNEQSTIVKIEVSGFRIEDIDLKSNKYQGLNLLSEIVTTQPGLPELPHIAKVLAIPDNGGVSVEIIEISEVEIFKGINVIPARESWIEGEPETPYEENMDVYKSASIYPDTYASLEQPSVFRDFRIARLSVFPVRYVPSKNEVHVVSSITVKINYGKGEEVNPKTAKKRPIAPSFAKLYKSFIYNYDNVRNSRYNEEEGREVMLCIMPDDFVNSFQPYADWKRKSGTDVVITKFSDIGATSYNASIIKEHITDAYHNWDYPPTYVLMVGDAGTFPVEIVNYDYSFANEDYFVEIDGNDFFPEMMIGRFTNQNDYKLQVMVNKFIKYEKEPYTTDTSWFKKGLCCSNNEYESQVYTKQFAASRMIEDGGFTSVDTMMSDSDWGSGCTYHLSNVIAAINEGRSYLNYRGEGWSDGWWANCYQFGTSSVSALNNGEKLTFVTSIGCGVAKFDDYGGNAFGEEWLELGTVDNPRGAVAFVGPTSNTHTTYNNRIDKGIYVGMFQEGMDTPGQALLRGKLYLYNVFGTDPMVEYHYRVFCILGDPSIHIWKDIPEAISVSHITSVPVGYSQPEFIITSTTTGLPIANAEVCLVGDDIFTKGYSDSLGVANVGITPEMEQTLSVVVRGGNVIPYEGTIDVVQSPEHVGPEEYPVIVDIDGNLDGIINPNENCNITFTLKNWGTNTSSNVNATLVSSNPDLVEVVTTSPVPFGDLSSGESFTGDSFQFHVLPGCSVGEIITLELHVTSSTSSWDYIYTEEVLGCQLGYHNFIVDDENELIPNFRMDPGETVKLYIMINNLGVDVATNVSGILASIDPYITIVDSLGSFGTIDTNAIAMNSSNHFVVTVDAACPDDYFASFKIKLSTEGGNYPYHTEIDFLIPVAVPMPSDYTGPDEYGYYAYSNSDTLYLQCPVYEWKEIHYMGEEFDVPNISNYTNTVDLPFTFKYYGLDYDELRISTDGWVAFGSGNQISFLNHELPYNDIVNNMVAAFWDDLHEGYWEQGKIFTYYDESNNRFIIEWDGIGHNEFSYDPKREYFQIILLDPDHYPTTTGDGEIIVQYRIVKQTRSNTVGIENDAQDIGLQYVFNKGYAPTASPLSNETAIKFTTESPLLPVSVEENPLSDLSIFKLDQNVPNPFSSNTTISYSLSIKANVKLSIYNINGKLVRTLQNGIQEDGNYSFTWNGTNDDGDILDSGIYFYTLSSEKFIETQKLLMIK